MDLVGYIDTGCNTVVAVVVDFGCIDNFDSSYNRLAADTTTQFDLLMMMMKMATMAVLLDLLVDMNMDNNLSNSIVAAVSGRKKSFSVLNELRLNVSVDDAFTRKLNELSYQRILILQYDKKSVNLITYRMYQELNLHHYNYNQHELKL